MEHRSSHLAPSEYTIQSDCSRPRMQGYRLSNLSNLPSRGSSEGTTSYFFPLLLPVKPPATLPRFPRPLFVFW